MSFPSTWPSNNFGGLRIFQPVHHPGDKSQDKEPHDGRSAGDAELRKRHVEQILDPPTGADVVRIRVGEGVCGACAVSGRTEVVPDVSADARYLACFSETRSEIVVPIVKKGRFWGEIDIDSGTLDAFGSDDVEFLEALAKLLAERV